MVEQQAHLDLVFASLSNSTRRDILHRVAARELSVGEIAASYDMSFAAVAKHIAVLEKARLVTKRSAGRMHIARFLPATLTDASSHLERYRDIWESRLDRLEAYLETKT